MDVLAFRLENFMCFPESDDEPVWVELKPISLIFGGNSSGKSALIRALRLLKQSLDDWKYDQPLVFNTDAGLDAGSFRSMIHRHELHRVMRFWFRVLLPRQEVLDLVNLRLNLEDIPLITPRDDLNQLDFCFGFGYDSRLQPGNACLVEVQIKAPWDRLPSEYQGVFKAERQVNRLEIDDREEWRYDKWQYSSNLLKDLAQDDKYELIPSRGFIPKLNFVSNDPEVDERERDFLWEYFPSDRRAAIPLYFIANSLLSDVSEKLISFFKEIHYLGPIRPESQRTFFLDEFDIARWDKGGLRPYLEFLAGNLPDLDVEIKKWLSRQYLALGEDVRTHNYLTDRNKPGIVSDVEFLDKSMWVNTKDVGSGASQVLPIIIMCLVAKPEQLVILEQPELHLHPRAQANLSDLFVLAARRGVSMLIETHSEHIYLRLRRWILETFVAKGDWKLRNDNVFLNLQEFRAYFVEHLQTESRIDRIDFSENGEELDYPDGFEDFFADDMLEGIELSRLIISLQNLPDSTS